MQRPGLLLLLVTFLAAQLCQAQKTKVGFDKTADFSQFKTYTWMKQEKPPVYPVFAMHVKSCVDAELTKAGLKPVEEHGDLLLVYAGGVGYGLNAQAATPILPTYSGAPPAIDATMWSGATGPELGSTRMVPEGELQLELVDVNTNKVVWQGSVREKFDLERKQEALELSRKAIAKLFKDFPPGKK